jgi:hypothetical protein
VVLLFKTLTSSQPDSWLSVREEGGVAVGLHLLAGDTHRRTLTSSELWGECGRYHKELEAAVCLGVLAWSMS